MPHSSIDEQVVKMSFDNSNFDSNVNDSIRTLNSLDKQLGILNKNNFSGITNSVNNLAKTFTVKGQVMLGVLTSLGNKIVNLGNQAFRKLTQGIRDGLGEYNQIIESTQTIYQNVKQNGNSLKDVNNALDELNDYADKTIYNFGQMTRMIGMFSSAGVGLKSSVSTIKGLANAAALVGATPEKAQIAWNAVSRALASGKFTNIVWRSLELSNIAGKQFNTVIKEVARVNKVTGKGGKNIDQMIKKYGSLRETLREGWLTNDIFTEAMQIMSGALDEADLKKKGYTAKQIKELRAIAEAAEEAATKVKTFKQLLETTAEAIGSGWAQSFRILIGDLEEAKELYTRISEVISGFIDNNARIRNELFRQIVEGKDRGILKDWKTGRDNFKQIIENMLAIVKTFLKSVKTGFLNIFPVERISAAARKVLDVVQNFTKALVINNQEIERKGKKKKSILGWDTETIENISEAIKDLIRFFRGLASAVDIAWMAISQPIAVIIKRIPFLNNFFENVHNGIVGLTGNLGKFGDKITVLRNALKSTNFFGAVLELLFDNIDELGKRYPIINSIVSIFRNLKRSVGDLKAEFSKLNIKPLNVLFGTFKMIVTAIWKVLNAIFNLLRAAKNSIDWSFLEGPKNVVLNALKTLSDYGAGLITFEQATSKISDAFNKVVYKITNAFSKLSDSFKGAHILKTMARVVGETEKKSNNLNTIIDNTNNKLTTFFNKIKIYFEPIGQFFKNIGDNINFSFDNIEKKIALIGAGVGAASIGIGSLVKAFKKMSIVNNINALLASGADALKAYQKQAESKAILNIAIAVGILAATMLALTLVPYERLEDAIVIFSAFMSVLTVTLTPLITAITNLNKSIYALDANPLNVFIREIGQFGKRVAKGLNSRMIGKAFRDIGIGIALFAASMIALKIAFKNPAEIVVPLNIIKDLIITLTIAVAGLIAVIEILSKKASKSSSIEVFSTFFKLSGVSKIILSIAAAVFVLANSMKIISSIDSDTLLASWGAVMTIIGLFGAIAIGITVISANANNFGKIKKLSISLWAAMAGLAVVLGAIALLIHQIKGDDTSAWWAKALGIFVVVMALFSKLIVSLLIVAKTIGASPAVWKHLNAYMIIVSACLATMAASLFLLGSAKPIPKSVVATLGIMVGALTVMASLLSLIAIIIAKSRHIYAGDFAMIIGTIALTIASLGASVGVLAAGMAALINALNAFDLSEKDGTKASTNLVNKIKRIATIIRKSLPKLKEIFFDLGGSVGNLFTSFVKGFADSALSMGDEYNKIIERFMDLVIDILTKVVDVFYRRKTEIAAIIGKILELVVNIIDELAEGLFTNKEKIGKAVKKIVKTIGKIITDFVNSFFSSTDGPGLFSDNFILGLLGIGGLTIGGIKGFGKLAADIKAITSLFGGMSKAGTAAAGNISSSFAKTAGNIWSVGAVTIAVVAAIGMVSTAVHAMRQISGKEVQYIRTDVSNLGDAILAVLTDWTAFKQAMQYGSIIFGGGIVSFWKHIFEGIAWIATGAFAFIFEKATQPLRILLLLLSKFDKQRSELWKNIYNNLKDYSNKIAETSDNLFKAAERDRKVFQSYVSLDTGTGNNFITGNYKTGYNGSTALIDGSVDGLENYSTVVGRRLTEQNKQVLLAWKDFWDINSPSKVAEQLYYNVMMGAAVGVDKGSVKVNQVVKAFNKGVLSEMVAPTQMMKEFLVQAGAISSPEDYYPIDSVKDMNVKIGYNDGAEKKVKEVELNRKLYDIMLEQANTLDGMNRLEAAALIKQEAYKKGLISTEAEARQAYDVIDAVLTRQENHIMVTAAGIKEMDKDITKNAVDLVGKEGAAMDMLIQDTYLKYNEMAQIAEDHKEELVGKKKSEVEEILKQEAIQRGMTEAEAEETAKMVSATMFAGKKEKEQIKKDEVDAALAAYKKDYEAFNSLEQAKLQLLQKYQELRAKAETTGYYQMVEKLRNKQITVTEYQDWVKSHPFEMITVRETNALNGYKAQYDAIIKKQQKDIKNMYTSTGIKPAEAAKKWNENYEKYLNLIGKTQSGKRGSFQTIIEKVKSALGLSAGDLNLGGWNFKLPNTNTALGDDKNIVNASKDLKENLEKNRADLTPTFDLDKLASDANKANGIVMSSLMAAQNASIGDYINKDSELNPFMKDRWQNVYNFTQNNYSPKALSRIDIYRQTQRQISMSRGF